MAAADNIAIIRRLYDEVWNRGDMSAADVLLSPAFEGGRETFKVAVHNARQSTGIHHEILDLRTEGDEVVAQVRAQSTVDGAFRAMDGVVRWRLVGGQVVGREAHWWPVADVAAAEDPAGVAAAVDAAERLLSRERGAHVRLTDATALRYPGRRNLLVRCRVADGPTGLPATLIVKQPRSGRYDPDTPTSPAHEVLSEWAALASLQLLNPDQPIAPRCYGGDRASGVLIMEDLGDSGTLLDTLHSGNAVAADRNLRRFAAAVGRMHATTIDQTAAHQHRRGSLGPLRPTILARLPSAAARMRAVLMRVGVEPGERFEEEITAVVRRLESPGPFTVLTHLDVCPVNAIQADGTIRLIDFEFAGAGHALLDAVGWHMHFTNNGGAGRVPPTTLAGMDDAYRHGLAMACPQIEDDATFASGLADAAAAWVLTSLAGGPPVPLAPLLEVDRDWGPATGRQRLLVRLDTFVGFAEHGQVPELQRVANLTRRALHARWPAEAGRDLSPYPAFSAGP